MELAGRRVDSLVKEFDRLFHHVPTAVATAPGRVNLIGEHLDYNGGMCLPIALPLTSAAAVRPREDGTVRIRSRQKSQWWESRIDDLAPCPGTPWWSYASGVLWAMQARGVEIGGFDVLVDGQVPLGAGLSSSAALGCSVALAVATSLGIRDELTTRRQLIADCVRAERDFAGAPTGGMDQTVSLLARECHALLIQTATGETSHLPWEPERSGHALMIIDTRTSHALNDGGYASRRASCDGAARRLGVSNLSDVRDRASALAALADDEISARRVRHVFTEVERVNAAVADLKAGDLISFGTRMVGSHASLRDDFDVSCIELDVAVDLCLQNGALGARMTGGGFGGSVIALLRETHRDSVIATVRDEFARRKWGEPNFWLAHAGPGAQVCMR